MCIDVIQTVLPRLTAVQTAPATTTAPAITTTPATTTTPSINRPPALVAPTASNGGSSQVGEVGATTSPVVQVRHVATSVGRNWADVLCMIWTVLSLTEARCQHSLAVLQDHPEISPRDRAMVLQWLS